VTDDVFSVLMHEAAAAISNADLEAAFVPSFQADVNRYIRLVAWFVRFDYVRQIQVTKFRCFCKILQSKSTYFKKKSIICPRC
jgi:hypothetical protein